MSAPALPLRHFHGRDGARLAYRELGEGRPLVLLHGFLASASQQWIAAGHAALLAARGCRVVMPDLRGHGDSLRSHDPADYPPDVLANDGFALIEQLGLAGHDGGYDLGGYSLGGRTTVRMLTRGAAPRRAIVAGMGLEGIVHAGGSGPRFRHLLEGFGSFAQASPAWAAQERLRSSGADPIALLRVLDTAVDTPREEIARIATPTLVAIGAGDGRHRSADALARLLPDSRLVVVPGDHGQSVMAPELGAAIAAFVA